MLLEASKVAVGSIYLTMRNVLTTIIGALGLALLARAITQEDMGTLAVLTLIMGLAQLISDFSLSSALSKYVAELKGRGEDFSAYFMATLTFKTMLTAIVSVILSAFAWNLASTALKSPALSSLIVLAAIDVFFASFMLTFNGLLLGAGLLERMAICQVLSTLSRWIAILILVYNGYGVYGAVMGWIIGDLSGTMIYAAASIRLIKLKRGIIGESMRLLPSLLNFSWPLLISSLILFLSNWYDQALVMIFLPLESVGIYNVSYRAFSVLAGLSTALGQALFPYYGMTYGRGDHEAISSAIKRASRYTMLIIFPLTLGLSATARPAITLFAGQQYEPGWSVLAIMSIFGLAYGILPAFSGILMIYEKTKTVMLLYLLSILSSLLLLPAVAPLGLNGLAIIKGVSIVVTLALVMHFTSKVVRIEIDREAFLKTLISASIMAAVVLAVQHIYYSKFLLPLYVAVGAVIYVAEIRALKMLVPRDIELLVKIIGERNAALISRLMGCDGGEKKE
ncbi:hypothetical protein DRO37_08550 [Candidatus Bathyarchaeota archaeon]|nr:MAG: hypothetical protein DRO37_08550 [Candidatus Bathyarchaeota archaeon]